MAQASCVLAFGLPLLLRVENYGSTNIEYSRGKGAWGASLVCRGFSYCLRAKVCVCVYRYIPGRHIWRLHQSSEKLELQVDKNLQEPVIGSCVSSTRNRPPTGVHESVALGASMWPFVEGRAMSWTSRKQLGEEGDPIWSGL